MIQCGMFHGSKEQCIRADGHGGDHTFAMNSIRPERPNTDPPVPPDPIEPIKDCPVCCARQVNIRRRYPTSPERTVCPTCLADRLANIRGMLDPDANRAQQAKERG